MEIVEIVLLLSRQNMDTRFGCDGRKIVQAGAGANGAQGLEISQVGKQRKAAL